MIVKIKTHYIIKISIFVVILIILDRGLGMLLEYNFMRTHSGQEACINNAIRENPDIIVIGSSRAKRHYNSVVLHEKTGYSTFNLGRDGQEVPYIYSVCDLIFNKCKPKYVIIEIRALSYMKHHAKARINRIQDIAPYMEQSPAIKELIYEGGLIQRIKYLSETFRYNGKLLNIIFGILYPDSSQNGFVPKHGNISNHLSTFQEPGSEPDIFFLNLLRKTICDIKNRGSFPILLTSPQWPNTFERDACYLKVYNEIKAIAAEEKIPYLFIDSNSFNVFNNPSLFVDHNHLNALGADIFSQILAAELLNNGFITTETNMDSFQN